MCISAQVHVMQSIASNGRRRSEQDDEDKTEDDSNLLSNLPVLKRRSFVQTLLIMFPLQLPKHLPRKTANI